MNTGGTGQTRGPFNQHTFIPEEPPEPEQKESGGIMNAVWGWVGWGGGDDRKVEEKASALKDTIKAVGVRDTLAITKGANTNQGSFIEDRTANQFKTLKLPSRIKEANDYIEAKYAEVEKQMIEDYGADSHLLEEVIEYAWEDLQNPKDPTYDADLVGNLKRVQDFHKMGGLFAMEQGNVAGAKEKAQLAGMTESEAAVLESGAKESAAHLELIAKVAESIEGQDDIILNIDNKEFLLEGLGNHSAEEKNQIVLNLLENYVLSDVENADRTEKLNHIVQNDRISARKLEPDDAGLRVPQSNIEAGMDLVKRGAAYIKRNPQVLVVPAAVISAILVTGSPVTGLKVGGALIGGLVAARAVHILVVEREVLKPAQEKIAEVIEVAKAEPQQAMNMVANAVKYIFADMPIAAAQAVYNDPVQAAKDALGAGGRLARDVADVGIQAVGRAGEDLAPEFGARAAGEQAAAALAGTQTIQQHADAAVDKAAEAAQEAYIYVANSGGKALMGIIGRKVADMTAWPEGTSKWTIFKAQIKTMVPLFFKFLGAMIKGKAARRQFIGNFMADMMAPGRKDGESKADYKARVLEHEKKWSKFCADTTEKFFYSGDSKVQESNRAMLGTVMASFLGMDVEKWGPRLVRMLGKVGFSVDVGKQPAVEAKIKELSIKPGSIPGTITGLPKVLDNMDAPPVVTISSPAA